MPSTTSTAVTVVVAALAGAASATLVLVLGSPSAPAAAEGSAATSPAVASPAGDVEALQEQLTALEIESRELRQRLSELEDRADLSARTSAGAPADELAAQVAAKLSADGATPAPAALKTEVAQALEQLRADERAEAARAREKRELQRIEERLVDLRTRLGLSPGQENDLRALLLAERAAEAEYDRQRDAGASRDSLRAVREQQRTEQQAQLAKILTPEQLESYRQRDNRRGGDAGGNAGNANGGNNNRGRGNRGG